MEKRQLDLDAPLLSVRRFSSTLGSTNGAKKMMIEKSLPHHRNHSLPSYKSEWELGDVTKPAAVPFLWEQIPGTPKCGSECKAQSMVEPSNTPRLPPGRAIEVPELHKDQNVFKPQKIEESPFNNIATLLESLNKGVDTEGNFDSESEYDKYSDALDTLSLTETLSMNCSVCGSDAKPCGTFSADFMMNRYLPAAKAMVLDTPQYVSKKPPLPVNKAVSVQRKPFIEQNRSDNVPHYDQYIEDTESEDEDYDSGKTSVKAFGLLSRFRLRNSLCLLNPVPGMKPTANSTTTPAKEISRMARTAYGRPLTQTADKHVGGAAHKRKFDSGARLPELHKVKSKMTSESHQFSYSGDLRMTRGSHELHKVKSKLIDESHQLSYSGDLCMTCGSQFQSFVQDIRCSHILVDSKTSSSARLSNIKGHPDRMEELRLDQGQRQPSMSSDYSRLGGNGKLDTNSENILKADDQGSLNVGSSLYSIPPPLPKLPSKSWLWRTLPSISFQHSKMQHAKVPTTGTKWENIVKTSNANHDHIRCSEELIPRISQHFKP